MRAAKAALFFADCLDAKGAIELLILLGAETEIHFGGSMEYQLAEKNAPGNVVAVKDCADDFEAEEWAHAWTKANGKSDEYRLECSGGGFSALLLKTVGGQWYMMRRS